MIIETERLIFRKWQIEDADALVDALNDIDLTKNMTMPFPYTREDAISFLTERQNDNQNSYYFAVVKKDDNKLVGGTSIALNEKGEFRGGVWVHRKFQGKGFGQEIFVARAKFAFDFLHLTEIRNGFFDFNERSKNMQIKMGYKIVGEEQNYSKALKKEVREIVTKLKKKDFEKYYQTLNFYFSIR